MSPRLDYSINSANTLTLRYQGARVQMDKEGTGNFNLAAKVYNQHDSEDAIQANEWMVHGKPLRSTTHLWRQQCQNFNVLNLS